MTGHATSKPDAAASPPDTDLILRLHQFAYNPSVHQPNPYVNVGKLNLDPYSHDMFGQESGTRQQEAHASSALPDPGTLISILSPERSVFADHSPQRLCPPAWLPSTPPKPELAMPLFTQTGSTPLRKAFIVNGKDSAYARTTLYGSATPMRTPSSAFALSPRGDLFSSTEEPHPIPLQFLSVFAEDEDDFDVGPADGGVSSAAAPVKPPPYRLRRDRQKLAHRELFLDTEMFEDEGSAIICAPSSEFSSQHDPMSSPMVFHPLSYSYPDHHDDLRDSPSPRADEDIDDIEESVDFVEEEQVEVRINGPSVDATPLPVHITRSFTARSADAPGALPTPLTGAAVPKRKRLATPETPFLSMQHYPCYDNFKENIPPSALRRVQSYTGTPRYDDGSDDEELYVIAPAVSPRRADSLPPAKRRAGSSGSDASETESDNEPDVQPTRQWQNASFTPQHPPPPVALTSSASFPAARAPRPGSVKSVIPRFNRPVPVAAAGAPAQFSLSTLRRTKSHLDNNQRARGGSNKVVSYLRTPATASKMGGGLASAVDHVEDEEEIVVLDSPLNVFAPTMLTRAAAGRQ
ncbi:hypothetical protein HKX48_006573 [Thoreauomyces humboldtii]|nr:hypothetical protein HKX48_006573 [Thoreauomyces humboldtii]